MKEERTDLHYQSGSSDKVYHVELEKDILTSRWLVNFQYGRRGNNLISGTKTPNGLSYNGAKHIYDTLVQSKIKKGYWITNSEELKEKRRKTLVKLAADLCLEGTINSDRYKTLRSLLNSSDENMDLAEKIIDSQEVPSV